MAFLLIRILNYICLIFKLVLLSYEKNDPRGVCRNHPGRRGGYLLDGVRGETKTSSLTRIWRR